MRYSIMLQLVASITFIFIAAALFARLQYLPSPNQPSNFGVESTEGKVSSSSNSTINKAL